jgi:thioredoxin 1
MAVKEVNDEQLREELEKNSNVVVKFYADWCGSCKLFAPKYKRLSEDDAYKDYIFLKVNAEKNPDARKWANVSNLPYFAVAREGQLIAGDFTAKEEGVIRLIEKLN